MNFGNKSDKRMRIRIQNDPDLAEEIANSATLFLFGRWWSLDLFKGNRNDLEFELFEWEVPFEKWWSKQEVIIQSCPDKSVNMIWRDRFYKCRINESEESDDRSSDAANKVA